MREKWPDESARSMLMPEGGFRAAVVAICDGVIAKQSFECTASPGEPLLAADCATLKRFFSSCLMTVEELSSAIMRADAEAKAQRVKAEAHARAIAAAAAASAKADAQQERRRQAELARTALLAEKEAAKARATEDKIALDEARAAEKSRRAEAAASKKAAEAEAKVAAEKARAEAAKAKAEAEMERKGLLELAKHLEEEERRQADNETERQQVKAETERRRAEAETERRREEARRSGEDTDGVKRNGSSASLISKDRLTRSSRRLSSFIGIGRDLEGSKKGGKQKEVDETIELDLEATPAYDALLDTFGGMGRDEQSDKRQWRYVRWRRIDAARPLPWIMSASDSCCLWARARRSPGRTGARSSAGCAPSPFIRTPSASRTTWTPSTSGPPPTST